MVNEVDDFSRGLADFGNGIRAIANRPRLWLWALAPAVLALIVLLLIGWLAYGAIDPLVDSTLGWLPNFIERWVAGFFRVIIIGLLLIGGYFVFFGVAALLAAPFNEFLSESLEAELRGEPTPPFSVRTFLFDLVIGMSHALRRVLVYLGSVVGLFFIGLLIPGLGTLVTTAISAYLTARFAAYDAMDAVWARRSWSYRKKMEHWRLHNQRTLGLGAGVSLMMLAPLANLFALSAGAAGATLLVIDLESKEAELARQTLLAEKRS